MLSIVIPVLNEIHTLPRILVAASHVLPGIEKEIVLVDDGSTDGTRQWIEHNLPLGRLQASGIHLDEHGHLHCAGRSAAAPITLRALFHDRRRGKGACLRSALATVAGSVVVIQDADLEYDPMDWGAMHGLIASGQADVVYGSRFLGRVEGRAGFVSLAQDTANRIISTLFGFLYGHRLSDVEVCYKMFRREVSDGLNVTCADFGCEIQISAQIVLHGGWTIREVPVSYRGRTRAQGKKISWRDGLKALWYLLRFRIAGGSGTGAADTHRAVT